METISCLVSYESPCNSGPNAEKTGAIAYILPFTPTYLVEEDNDDYGDDAFVSQSVF